MLGLEKKTINKKDGGVGCLLLLKWHGIKIETIFTDEMGIPDGEYAVSHLKEKEAI